MHFPTVFVLLSLVASASKDAVIRTPPSLSSHPIAAALPDVLSRTHVAKTNEATAHLQGDQAPTVPVKCGRDLITSIVLGAQAYDFFWGAGSSDTWLVTSGYTCFDRNTPPMSTKVDWFCGIFYEVDDPSTHIPNEYFNTCHTSEEKKGVGEIQDLTIVGPSSVLLVGITVPGQDIRVVNLVPHITNLGINPSSDSANAALDILLTPLVDPDMTENRSYVMDAEISGVCINPNYRRHVG
jgi:hypothetical protein